MQNHGNSRPSAQQLLELHLKHEMDAFDTDRFMAWADEEIRRLYVWLSAIPLNHLVDADQIKKEIEKNVVERDVPPAVAECAGEASTRLFTSEMHGNTKVREIFSTKLFEEFIDKLLELQEQRHNGLNTLIDLPIYKELISNVLYQAILRYIYETNFLSKNVPGVSSMVKMGRKVVNRTAPKLENTVEESVKSYIASNLGFLLRKSKTFLNESMTDEQLKSSAMDLWDLVEDKRLGDIQQGMDSLDLSEFVVLGYEFWLAFRKTSYFRDSYELVVDYVFEKYGESELGLLFEDFQITPERILEEVERFAPRLLTVMRSSGHLEGVIRRRLESFYHSVEIEALLS
ncbi:hypothetical protein BTA51_24515 [Hahella sp. CCB-MM4]|uniref:hypothetical protein n=1 Tax=Hahella sp. (strain CCB-MM4) TaxID=1926491 RepID=UPI000B9B75DE|nr:hypothetical protein [Hahella sp. CCB-MM4]OZG70750.1 hypothetical protein BTA51_24515 [Hahella sp. CCB-MM4]